MSNVKRVEYISTDREADQYAEALQDSLDQLSVATTDSDRADICAAIMRDAWVLQFYWDNRDD